MPAVEVEKVENNYTICACDQHMVVGIDNNFCFHLQNDYQASCNEHSSIFPFPVYRKSLLYLSVTLGPSLLSFFALTWPKFRADDTTMDLKPSPRGTPTTMFVVSFRERSICDFLTLVYAGLCKYHYFHISKKLRIFDVIFPLFLWKCKITCKMM